MNVNIRAGTTHSQLLTGEKKDIMAMFTCLCLCKQTCQNK